MWSSRLMIVDDDDVAAVICRVAENLGFHIRTTNGLQAFGACAEFEPDVIVLDIFMPEIDGFEVLRYLGRTHKHISVVIVSGKDASFRGMAEHMCEQHGLHMVATVAKPFTLAQLQSVLVEAKKFHPIHLKLIPSSFEGFLDNV